MIKLERGNSVFWCETPEQAVQLHRLLQSEPAPASKPSGAHTEQKRVNRVNGHSPAHQFLKSLNEHQGMDLTAPDLVKIIGVGHVNGVGARLKKFRKILAAASPPVDLDDYLSSKRNDVGSTTWTVLRQVQM